MLPRLLYIGYRIDEPRLEAVTINAALYRDVAEGEGYEVDMLPYRGGVTTVRELWRFLAALVRYCRQNENVVIHDFFVMPALSRLILAHLHRSGVAVGYVKSFSNPPGGGSWRDRVGLHRMVFNRTATCAVVARRADVTTYHDPLPFPTSTVLSVPLPHEPKPMTHHEGRLRCAYLGHALPLKGVDLFPDIVARVNQLRPDAAEFRFSFSEHWDSRSISARLEALGCRVEGPTDPQAFFQESDVYVLPIRSRYSAAGAFNTIWEAMSCGCCVMTRNDPQLVDILDPSRAVLLDDVTPEAIAAQLVSLIDDRGRLNTMRRAAQQAYAATFAARAELVRQQLRSIYEHARPKPNVTAN